MILRIFLAAGVSLLAACGGQAPDVTLSERAQVPDLYPGETPQMRALVEQYAEVHGIPEQLLHRVIQRESDYNPRALNGAGPYYGLMQILPATARSMGFRGEPRELLDPEVNLTYAGRYLRGAWLVSDGDIDEAVQWYARGYYYEARNRCMLVETGLKDREIARHCR
jgi:soluble lytic murein transglycosylase-like protein